MTAELVVCNYPKCQVADTGVCSLGKEPIELCEHYSHDTPHIVDDAIIDESSSEESVSSDVVITSGDVLQMHDIPEVSRVHRTHVVALVGEQRAGKTTLLASLYAMYCKGLYAGLTFAGSRTLVGFAKRHHLALLSSGRAIPATPRTSRDDPPAYFHLDLAYPNGDHVNLVISDRSGELYEAARLDTSLIGDHSELHVADRICFLLDGDKLSNVEKRTAYGRQFKQLIHALKDNGALSNAKTIEVLSTKFDVTSTVHGGESVAYLEWFERNLVSEFEAAGLSICCYRVCARPISNKEIGFVGLEALVARWCSIPNKVDVIPLVDEMHRQIDTLLDRDMKVNP